MDQQLDKSKDKSDKKLRRDFVFKPAQNELHKFISKLNQSLNKMEYCKLFLNLLITFHLNQIYLNKC